MRRSPAFPEGAQVEYASSAFYERRMGFRIDWTYENQLAGMSKDATRIFLRRRMPHEEERGCNVLVDGTASKWSMS